MKVYAWVWRVLWAVVVLLSVTAAWLAWPDAAAPVMFLTSGALIGALALYYHQDHRPPGPPSRDEAYRCFVAGVVGGTCTVALLFLAVTAAPLAWPLLALCAGTSPAALRWAHRAVRGARRRAHAAPVLRREDAAWWDVLKHETTLLSDGELCAAWRASFSSLIEASDATAREQVVLVRELYLDELSARHPDAMTAWLASNPRAASGPERFLGDAAA
jgi:hypothetical protein